MSSSEASGGDFQFAIELENDYTAPQAYVDGDGMDAYEEQYADYTSGALRRRREHYTLWRGEDVLGEVSKALGRQLKTIASEVSTQLDECETEGRHYRPDSAEISFGMKLAADAGKAIGIFTVSAERSIQVKLIIKRAD